MPYTFAIVRGRTVVDQNDRLLAAFSSAFDAIAYAAAVNAGEIQIERKVS